MTLRISEEDFTAARQLAPIAPGGFAPAVHQALEALRASAIGADLLKEIEQAGEELAIVRAGPGVENKCAQKLDTEPACDAACYREVLDKERLAQKIEALKLAPGHPARRKYEKFHGEHSIHKAPGLDGKLTMPLAHRPKNDRRHESDQILANRIQMARLDPDDIPQVNKAVPWVQQLQNGLVGYHLMNQLTPGTGTGAWVVWNPALIDTGADLPLGKQAPWMKRPTWLALAHELIHGWRLVTGRCVFRPNARGEYYYEEAMTVGLPPYDGCRFTENRLRHDKGLPIRSFYGAETQLQSVAAEKKHGTAEVRVKLPV
jgi:hypothetical protein